MRARLWHTAISAARQHSDTAGGVDVDTPTYHSLSSI